MPDGPRDHQVGERRNLPANVRLLWILGSLVVPAILAIGAVVAWLAVPDDVFFPPLGLLLAAVATLGVGAALWARARFARWTYVLTDDWVEATWGVLSRTSVIVPRNRVQTISLNHGPIDRLLDLETIVIHTAGSYSPNLEIPHVRPATVEWMTSELGTVVAEEHEHR